MKYIKTYDNYSEAAKFDETQSKILSILERVNVPCTFAEIAGNFNPRDDERVKAGLLALESEYKIENIDGKEIYRYNYDKTSEVKLKDGLDVQPIQKESKENTPD